MRFYTVAEVAAELAATEEKVRGWIAECRLLAITGPDGEPRIPAQALIANKQAAGLLPPAAPLIPQDAWEAFAQGEGYSDPIEGGRVQTPDDPEPAA